jgi:hypothetical protein
MMIEFHHRSQNLFPSPNLFDVLLHFYPSFREAGGRSNDVVVILLTPAKEGSVNQTERKGPKSALYRNKAAA